MENKIRKLQAGSMFPVYQPLPISPVTPSAPQGGGAGASGGDESIINEDVLKQLMGEGLTNDVMAFSDNLQRAYTEYTNMSDIARSTQYGQHLRNIMRGDWGRLNHMRRNKQLMDEALSKIKSNNADSDFAVTPNGVVLKDLETGQVAEVSYSEYAENYRNNSKYRMLTNAELVNEREYNPNLVNDINSLTILNNAVGMTKVKEEVLKILSDLGSEKKSMSTEQYLLYGSEGDKEIASAAKQLIGDGLAGFYKVGRSESTEENLGNLKLAQETMWLNLSPNAKSLLRARALSNGADIDNLEEVAKQYAVSLLSPASSTSESIESRTDYDATMSKNAGIDGSEGGDSLTGKIGYYERVAASDGDLSSYEIDMGDGNTLNMLSWNMGALQHEGKPLGMTPLREITEILNIGDTDNVFIGDVKVPKGNFNSLVYSGGSAQVMEVPVEFDPRTRTYAPDFDMMENYNKAVRELKTTNVATERETIIRENGLNPTKDAEGNVIIGTETAKFLVFDGMINSKGNPDVSNSRLLKQVSSNEEKAYKSLYKYGNFTNSGEQVVDATDYDGWLNFDIGRNVYNGVVFVKLNEGLGGRPLYKSSRATDANDTAVPKSVNTPGFMGTRQNYKDIGNTYSFNGK